MRAFGRFCLLSLALLALAACTDPAPPRRNPVMTGEALLSADGTAIQARLFDIPPGADILAIMLVAPDGSETASGPFQQSYSEKGPGYGPTGIGVSVSGGSNSGLATGVSVGVNSGYGGPSLASASLTTEIRPPDPARLLEERRAWQVVARWVEAGGAARELPLAWRFSL